MPQVGIYIDANTGNLGIGTTSPIVPLHVNGIAKASTLSGIGQGFAYMEVLTSGTSWTVPANVYRIKVTLVGGGGGSGGADVQTSGGTAGGGGGGGGLCIGFYTVIPGQTMTYAIGAGGTAGASTPTDGAAGGTTTTTYNAITYTATGGAGGVSSTNSIAGVFGAIGGTASGGVLNLSGQSGGKGSPNTAEPGLIIPNGGNAALGYGYGGELTRSYSGFPGVGYGGGASGPMNISASSKRAGADGAPGVIIVEY